MSTIDVATLVKVTGGQNPLFGAWQAAAGFWSNAVLGTLGAFTKMPGGQQLKRQFDVLGTI